MIDDWSAQYKLVLHCLQGAHGENQGTRQGYPARHRTRPFERHTATWSLRFESGESDGFGQRRHGVYAGFRRTWLPHRAVRRFIESAILPYYVGVAVAYQYDTPSS